MGVAGYRKHWCEFFRIVVNDAFLRRKTVRGPNLLNYGAARAAKGRFA